MSRTFLGTSRFRPKTSRRRSTPSDVLARLIVIFFESDGSGNTFEKPAMELTPDDQVTIDLDNQVWYYRRGLVHEAKFSLGTGVRVTDIHNGEELFGPMMVYDPENPTHRAAAERNKADALAGKLEP